MSTSACGRLCLAQTASITLVPRCVAENALSGTIPPSFGQLTSLTELHIGENELSGSLPATISGMSSLEKLVLWENELTAIDPETERPPALSECSLQVGTAACKRPLSLGCVSHTLALCRRELFEGHAQVDARWEAGCRGDNLRRHRFMA